MPMQHKSAYANSVPTKGGSKGFGDSALTGKKMAVGEGGVFAGGGSKGGVPKGGAAAPALAGDSREQQMILNLKQQVEQLDAANRAMRELGAGASAGLYAPSSVGVHGSMPTGVDGAIRQLRSDYQRTEEAHKAREAEMQQTHDRLRKEALAAKLRERKALDEVAEAKDHLTEQREKFAAARQELTAEVIAYQRDLDELAHQKRQLQADLADAVREVRQRDEFVQGFDTQKRLLQSQLDEKIAECLRAQQMVSALKVELSEERIQAAGIKERYEALRAQHGQVGELNRAQLEEACEAKAELRKMQIDLEAEQAARKHADETKHFLVLEAAKLEATIRELTASADFVATENARLKADADNNKVTKVIGRFMVRKMREKLNEAKASEANMRENQNGLNGRFVKAEQKAAAIENELMVLRRRQAEREAAFEQQRQDASDLSIENRMLLEKTEQLVRDAQRAVTKRESLEAANVELLAELDVMRERAEVAKALSAFKPEELASISRVNAELADSINSLLPKLGPGGSAAGGSAGAATTQQAAAPMGYPLL